MTDYKVKLHELIELNMTEKGFKLWLGIDSMIPDIWSRPSSSTGKYHQKENGMVPDIAEHTYEMLNAGIKIMRMIDIEKKTSKCDALIFSIGLHDRLKYGEKGDKKHTTKTHDRDIADLLEANFHTFQKIMSNEDIVMMVESCRFHSGQWSTNVSNKNNFKFTNFLPETQFVHMLDMLSTANCLKLPTE